MEKVFVGLRHVVGLHHARVVAERKIINIAHRPIALRVFQLSRILSQVRRVKTLQIPALFYHRRRHGAVDDIDFVAFSLILREHFLDQPLGVPAEIFYLKKRIFFFKSFFDRAHDLIDDQRCVPRDLAFLLSAFDENFLPIRFVVKRNLIHRRRV